jgi:hypothetical protein
MAKKRLNDRKKEPKAISDTPNSVIVKPSKIMAWAHQVAGLTIKESAIILKVSEPTINRYRADMAEFMSKDIDVNALRAGVYALFPNAMDSMERLLFAGDSPATIAFFKGMGLFVDKREIDGRNLGANSSDDLIRKLNELGISVVDPSTNAGSDGDSQGTRTPS